MKLGRTSYPQGTSRPLDASKITRGLISAAIVTGCGSLIGIDDAPPASECIRNEDCAVGSTCIDFRCVGSAGGAGGEAGDGGGGTGGRGGSTAGSGVGGRSGAAGDDAGASGLGPSGLGGQAGRGGSGGTAGHAGETGGDGGEPPIDVGGAGAGGAPEPACEPSRCLKCDEGDSLVPVNTCAHACNERDGCVIPKSCNGAGSPCGSNVSCCLSYTVMGGSFARSCDSTCGECDATYPATVTTFSLDAFEVNVGRFRAFLAAYETALPATGQGANPHNVDDVGWRAEWNVHLPATREDLIARITSECGESHTWTEAEVGAEDHPINCVSWYVANAFCIWDGGRLPTQAEWNYAAAGGAEQRLYPWSVPHDSSVLDETYAVYELDGAKAVGRRPNGRGKWLHHDLAGNLWEWVFDDYEQCYATPDRCDDCGIATASPLFKTARGGGYFDLSDDVTAAARTFTEGEVGYSDFGFRCARDL